MQIYAKLGGGGGGGGEHPAAVQSGEVENAVRAS